MPSLRILLKRNGSPERVASEYTLQCSLLHCHEGKYFFDGRFANISVISLVVHIFQKFKKRIKLEKLALSVDPPFGVKSGGKEPPRAYKKQNFFSGLSF